MSLAGVLVGTSNELMKKRLRRLNKSSNQTCPSLNQWHWLRHIVRSGKDVVLSKALTAKEKKEIVGSLISIDRWLEERFATKFELPLYGDR